MPNAKLLEEVSARLTALFAAGPAHDLEKNVKAMLAGVFERFDLVTREEFELQKSLLQEMRARLARLEAQQSSVADDSAA